MRIYPSRQTVRQSEVYIVEATDLKQGVYLSTKAYCMRAASFPPEARIPVSSDKNSAAVVLEEKGFTCRYSAWDVWKWWQTQWEFESNTKYRRDSIMTFKKKKKVQHIGYPVCTVSSTSLNLEFKHGAQGALKQHHTNTTHLTKQQTRKVTYILYCGLGREVTAHTHATKVRNICYGAFSMSKNTSSNSIINIHPSYHNRPTASQPPKPSHALLGR